MRKWLIMACSLLLGDLCAQVSDYRTDKLEGLSLSSGDMVIGKKLDGPETVGSRFLYDDWLSGDIITFNDSQHQFRLKYNVEHDVLAAFDPREGKEYYLKNSKIKEFTLKGRRFLNKGALSDSALKDDGFVEILFSGQKISLVKKHFTQTLKPTYKEGLHMGTRDFRIVKKEELQILLDNSFGKVPAQKGDFVRLFGRDQAAVEKYLKAEKLNFKIEKDLRRVAAFYDQLDE